MSAIDRWPLYRGDVSFGDGGKMYSRENLSKTMCRKSEIYPTGLKVILHTQAIMKNLYHKLRKTIYV